MNPDYIVLQFQNEVDVYQRGQTDVFYMLASLNEVDQFLLLNTDNLMVFYNNTCVNYQVTIPAITINGLDQNQETLNVYNLTATSTYSMQSTTCMQQFYISFY